MIIVIAVLVVALLVDALLVGLSKERPRKPAPPLATKTDYSKYNVDRLLANRSERWD